MLGVDQHIFLLLESLMKFFNREILQKFSKLKLFLQNSVNQELVQTLSLHLLLKISILLLSVQHSQIILNTMEVGGNQPGISEIDQFLIMVVKFQTSNIQMHQEISLELSQELETGLITLQPRSMTSMFNQFKSTNSVKKTTLTLFQQQ